MRDALLRRLVEFETTPDAPAPDDGPAPPEPSEPQPDSGDEPAPSTEPEASWVGPSEEEWQQTQAALGSAMEFIQQLQTPYYPEPAQEQQELPPYDPYDPEAATAHMDARDQRLLAAMEQMLAPINQQYQDQTASQWAEQTFARLGVPEEAHWRDGVLFASAGFQQFDPQGRPLVNPQQAAAQGYAFLKSFAEAERAAERELISKQGQQQDEALRARAESPDVPSGSAGVEGVPDGLDELQAARIWRERQAATS